MSTKPRIRPRHLVLSVPLALRPRLMPADSRVFYLQFESREDFLPIQRLAGGAGSPERTRLRRFPC